MRVLVAFEDLYRTYRETIAAAIRVLRPHLEVTTTGLHDLEGEVARHDTRVVISSQERLAHLRPEVTWIEVPLEAGTGSDVTLEAVLEDIDKAETPPAGNPTVKTRRSQAGWPPSL
jgi:alcohol dehydrogenase class IV